MKDNQLKNTLTNLQKALSEWDSIIPESNSTEASAQESQPTPASIVEAEIRKKTQELLEKLNEQIKELGF